MEKQSFIEQHKSRLTQSYNEQIQPPLGYENNLLNTLQAKIAQNDKPSVFFRPFLWAAASIALLLGTLTVTSIRPEDNQETSVNQNIQVSSLLLAADDIFDYHLIEIMDSFEENPVFADAEDDAYWHEYTFDELIEINTNS